MKKSSLPFTKYCIAQLACLLCCLSGELLAETSVPDSSEVAPVVRSDGSRLRVTGFIIEGMNERISRGITLEKLQALISAKKSVFGNRLSVSEIHHIADHLTKFYHAAGFPFSRVLVPEQEVVNNVVRLRVVEGVVASVDVRGNSLYAAEQLQTPFSSIVGEIADTDKIESLLRQVNSFPGIQTFGYFSKGVKPGETRINIKVQKEEAWQLLTKIDNYGAETTGSNRGLVSLSINNPFGVADQMSIGLLQSFDGKEGDQNTTYGAISYRAPVFHSTFSIGGSFSNNQFDIGRDFSDLGLQGEASIARLDVRYQWSQSRSLNGTLALYGDRKTSELKSGLTTDVLDKSEISKGIGALLTLNYQAIGGSVQQQFLVDAYSGQYHVTLGDDAILDTQDKVNGEKERFTKLQLRYRFRWDWLWLYSQIEWSVRGQYTNVELPSVEQISASGPYAVRALETGFYSADKGMVSSLQWRLMHPRWLGRNIVSQSIVPFIFYDGVLMRRLLREGEEFAARGFGVGFDFNIKATSSLSVFGRMTMARTHHIEQQNKTNGELNATIDPQQQNSVYGEFNVRF